MRDVVIRSIEDVTEQRCVDIVRLGTGEWAFVECRRDPEDGRGWSRIAALSRPFATQSAAQAAAEATVGWLTEAKR